MFERVKACATSTLHGPGQWDNEPGHPGDHTPKLLSGQEHDTLEWIHMLQVNYLTDFCFEKKHLTQTFPKMRKKRGKYLIDVFPIIVP